MRAGACNNLLALLMRCVLEHEAIQLAAKRTNAAGSPSQLACLSFLESAKPKKINSNKGGRVVRRLRKTRGDNYHGLRFVDTLDLKLHRELPLAAAAPSTQNW